MRQHRRSAIMATIFMAACFALTACSGGVGPQASEQAQQGENTAAPAATEGSVAPDSGTSDAADGTMSAACLEISEAMSGASEGLAEALQDGLTDTERVKEAIAAHAESLKNAVATMTNAEVKAKLQAVADDMGDFSAIFQDLPDLSNPASWASDPVTVEKVSAFGAKMQTVGEELSTSITDLLTFCDLTP